MASDGIRAVVVQNRELVACEQRPANAQRENSLLERDRADHPGLIVLCADRTPV